MYYIIDENKLKEVIPTIDNIQSLKEKEFYSIRCMYNSYYAVFVWNKYGNFWQQISKNYIDKGWAVNFLKRKARRLNGLNR